MRIFSPTFAIKGSVAGKLLPVEGVAVNAVIENEEVVAIHPFDAARLLRLDDERAEKPETDLLRGVVMRVVHVRARVRYRELVGVRLSRLDRGLCDEGHPIYIVRRLEAVEVDRRRFAELVPEHDANAISFTHPNLWAGHLSVVRHRGNALPRRGLPLDL